MVSIVLRGFCDVHSCLNRIRVPGKCFECSLIDTFFLYILLLSYKGLKKYTKPSKNYTKPNAKAG
nr:MAG TPA: hypothetical protein [Caudoviricetes sp.]